MSGQRRAEEAGGHQAATSIPRSASRSPAHGVGGCYLPPKGYVARCVRAFASAGAVTFSKINGEIPGFSTKFQNRSVYCEGVTVPATRAAIYLRVSNLDHNPQTLHDLRQTATLRGYQIVKEYADRNSAAKGKHPNLDQLISDARSGSCDVIMVGALSDVACSVKQCLLVLDQLNQLGIGFVSCQPDIDTTGELGQGIAATVCALSQLQRTLVGEAVKAGMRRSRLEGVRLGRAPLNVNRVEIVKDRALGLSLTDVAKKHGVSRGLVSRIVKLANGRASSVTPCTAQATSKPRATYPTFQVPAVPLTFPCASAES